MTTAVRLVRIITRLNIGGPAIQAATLSRPLEAQGFSSLLVYGRLADREGDMSYLIPKGVRAVHLPRLCRPVTPRDELPAWWQIYRLLCQERPAIVHTHLAKAGMLGRLATLAYNRTAGRHEPAKLVHTYHGHVFDGYFRGGATRVFVGIERLLARWTDVLIAISPQVKHDILVTHRIGRDEQFRVVPLGFDLSPFAAVQPACSCEARQELGVPADAAVVTTVGRLTAIKHHELFLEVAQIVAAERRDAVFLIAGDGERRQTLEDAASARGLEARVRFLGWRRDLPRLYAASDVFLLTSRNEGTPVALIEAMAAGVPGVSTDVGGVRDVVSNEQFGLLAPSGDAAALARAVLTVLAAPQRRRLSHELRHAIVDRYGRDRLVSDLVGVYRALLAQDQWRRSRR